MYAAPGQSKEARVEGFPTGLTGTVRFRILDNAGGTSFGPTTTDITEDPLGSGSYIITFTAPTTQGDFSLFWDTGTVSPGTTVSEDLVVTMSAPAPDIVTGPVYATVDELKATLSLTGTSFADDDLQDALVAASRVVDHETGQRFYLDADATQVRYFDADDAYTGELRIDDLVVLTELAVDTDGDGVYEQVWTSGTDFVLEPRNAPADGRPYKTIRILRTGSYRYFPDPTYYPDAIRVTGQFGWAAVPQNIKIATKMIAARVLKVMREAPFGVAGLGADGVAVRVSRTIPDLDALLAPYRRTRLFV